MGMRLEKVKWFRGSALFELAAWVCVLRFVKGETDRSAQLVWQQTLETKRPFKAEAVMNSSRVVQTNPHRAGPVEKVFLLCWNAADRKKHPEILLPFWAPEQCAPQLKAPSARLYFSWENMPGILGLTRARRTTWHPQPLRYMYLRRGSHDCVAI